MEDRAARRLVIECKACDGYGARARPTATASGSTGTVLVKCRACRGNGRRRGFHPPI